MANLGRKNCLDEKTELDNDFRAAEKAPAPVPKIVSLEAKPAQVEAVAPEPVEEDEEAEEEAIQSTEKEATTQSTSATSKTMADEESEDDSDFDLLDENGELRDDFG